MTRYYNNNFLENEQFLFHTNNFEIFYDMYFLEPHDHEFIELVYIYGGSGLHLYEGQTYPVREGDVFIIQPYMEHSYKVEPGYSIKGCNILFQPQLLSSELEMLSQISSFVNFLYIEPFLRKSGNFQSHLILDPYEQMEFKLILDRLVKEFSNKQPGYRVLVKTYLVELFIYLSRCYDKRMHYLVIQQEDDEMRISKICSFIEKHHTQPISLEQLSHMCCMSQSNFKKKFKQYTGRTFLDYRNDMRLKLATALLKHTDTKVMTIAHQAGFDDLSNFNKSFKKALGVTPKQYRTEE
ncbi:MAG TPA: AraC family transcriptional regulator [Bacilli bacterium]